MHEEVVSSLARCPERATVSLKLSQLGLAIEEQFVACLLSQILQRARDEGVGAEIDMEQFELHAAHVECVLPSSAKGGPFFDGWRRGSVDYPTSI